jgi:molybdopterin-guanine dinucleotide biosynthesis protein A
MARARQPPREWYESMMQRTVAIILAGGASTRMGRDKAAIEVGGRSLLQWVADAAVEAADSLVVVQAPGADAPPLSARVPLHFVADAVLGAGPLAGLLAGLEAVAAAETEVALVLACDQPFVRPALLRLLASTAAEAGAVVAVVDGRTQPLCAAVRIEAAATLHGRYAAGARAMSTLLDIPGARLLAESEWRSVDPDGISFIGANTPTDLARCEQVARGLA